MAAYYDLRKSPNPSGETENQNLHPRIVSKGTIDTDELVKEISERCSLSEADMQSALSALTARLAFYLNEGYRVELGEIGYFIATLKSRAVKDKKEIRSTSISFDNVNFRAKTCFRARLKGELTRAPYGFRQSSDLSSEKRKELVEAYLASHPFMSRSEYSRLTGRLKTIALKDLNEWVKQGYLKKHGSKSSLVYLKND